MQEGDSTIQPSTQHSKQPPTPPCPILQFTMTDGPTDEPRIVPETTPDILDGESCDSRQQSATTIESPLASKNEKTQHPHDDYDVGEGTISVSPCDANGNGVVASADPVEEAPELSQHIAPPVSENPESLLDFPSTATPSSLGAPAGATGPGLSESADISSGNSIGQVLLPNRPAQDIARDTKRILEICYGPDAVSASKTIDCDGNLEGASTTDVGPGRDDKGRKKQTRKRKIRKSSEASLAREGEVAGEEDRIGEDGTAPTKKKSSKKKSVAKSTHTTEDGDGNTSTLKKKKKKKVKVKKELLPRDAAGRIVRKRRKIKGRHKVVRSQFIKKGKDVKTDLPTITEDDLDDEYGESGDEEYDDDGDRDGEEDRHIDDVDSADQLDDDYSEQVDGDDDDDDDYEDDDVSDDDEDCEGTGDDDNDHDTNEVDGKHEVDKQDANGCSQSDDVPRSCVGLNNVVIHDDNQEPSTSTVGNNEHSPLSAEPVLDIIADAIVVDLEAKYDTPQTEKSGEASIPLEQSFGSSDCTTSAHEDSSDKAKPRFLASNQRKACAGFLLVTAVAALVVSIMFASSGIGKESNPAPASVVNNTAQATLAPSTNETLSPSAPETIGNETLSPTNPCQIPGVQIFEAETAQRFGNATVGTEANGYCQEGYVGGLVSSGTRVRFSKIEIETTGLYRVRLRYSNAIKRNLSLTLQIDNVNIDDFRCTSTGNWSNWMIDYLDDVPLHEGSHMVVVLTDEDREEGPLMDWIGFELKSTTTRFEYVTNLLSPYINFTAPSEAQVSTLLWLSSIDQMDWSTMTNRQIMERFILVEFYYSTEGDLWSTNNEWVSELHVCFWFGVSCSDDDLVTDLMLGEYGVFPS